MAVTQSRDNRSILAAADLRTQQFKFISLDAKAEGINTGAGLAAFGLCISGANTGDAMTVTRSGKTMVICGGTVTVGGDVAADAAGAAVDATVGDIILGVAYEAGVSAQVISIELNVTSGNVKA